MILWFLIFCLFAVGCLFAAVSAEELNGFLLGWFSFVFAFIAILIGIEIWHTPAPSAIDVYRGRTTLEVTYRDSLAVDSVVVFKDEFKEE